MELESGQRWAADRGERFRQMARDKGIQKIAAERRRKKKDRALPVEDQLKKFYSWGSTTRKAVKKDRGIARMVYFALEHLLNEDLVPFDCPHPCYWAFLLEARSDKKAFFKDWVKPAMTNAIANKTIRDPGEKAERKSNGESKAAAMLNGSVKENGDG